MAATCASCDSCAATSSLLTYPFANWWRKISSMLVLMVMSSRVASICARNDASWMAPAATFVLKRDMRCGQGKTRLLFLRLQRLHGSPV